MPAEALTHEELTQLDGAWPVLIAARVVRPVGWNVEPPVYRDAWNPQDTLPVRHSDLTIDSPEKPEARHNGSRAPEDTSSAIDRPSLGPRVAACLLALAV
jgi:hypothetical protein